jgi:hypothetical protein
MPAKGSRYQDAVFFRGENGEAPKFRGQRPRAIGAASAVLEYRIKEGDRLDLLALYFYNNDRKWWRLLDANPWVIFGDDLSLAPYVGETLFIPAVLEQGGST